MFALHVGVRAAVAMVRVWVKFIVLIYFFGIISFFLAALATVWLYFGGPNWVGSKAPHTVHCHSTATQCTDSTLCGTGGGARRGHPHMEA